MTAPTPASPPSSSKKGLRVTLWVVAVLVMLGAYVYQRRTGPTYELRGTMEIAGEEIRYSLLRSQETTEGALIAVPAPEKAVQGVVHYRRYPTGEAYAPLKMESRKDEDSGEMMLAARLPVQPAAGKIEYYVSLGAEGRTERIPEDPEDSIILRYKDPVPLGILAPHICFMFFGLIFGFRALLGALFFPREIRMLAWITLGLVTMGGMLFGPIMQKYAFGAFWTGFPYGYDLTDNKTLIMWVVWLLACGIVGWKRREISRVGRGAVVFAGVIMMVVYLIPHSMRGSELDYSKLDDVKDPKEAIGTGR